MTRQSSSSASDLVSEKMLEIRGLVSADASVFQALRLMGLRECPTAFSSSYEEECGLDIRFVAERLAPREDGVAFGAFDEGALIGVVGLKRESHRKLAHKAFIWGMYVNVAFRNRGVGRQLMERALQHAGQMPGLRQVNLGVNAANAAAIALYERVGFRAYGVERDFLMVDGILHDEIHMTHVLP